MKKKKKFFSMSIGDLLSKIPNAKQREAKESARRLLFEELEIARENNDQEKIQELYEQLNELDNL